MGKDDYFVIVYKLLKYLYECLKKGVQPSMDVVDADYFSIGSSYWNYIVVNLCDDGYITGVPTFHIAMNPDKQAKVSVSIKITPKGIQYLEENTVFQKIKNAAKDISDILPL